MKRFISVVVCCFVVLAASACSNQTSEFEMDTKTTGAVAGGVVGAGLGALIVSDAAAGAAVGAAAGGATGYVVGDMLQGQEEMIQTQDEALERQEQMISAHRKQIEELKRMSDDRITFNDKPQEKLPGTTSWSKASSPLREERRVGSIGTRTLPLENEETSPVARRIENSATVVASSRPPVGKGSFDWDAGSRMGSETGAVAQAAVSSGQQRSPGKEKLFDDDNLNVAGALKPAAPRLSGECEQAKGEISKAKESSEMSDRLFHYRRALRLCPDDPSHHNGLGEIYLSLDRKVDAEFEFQQALNIDPGFAPAKQNLAKLQASG